MGATGLLFCSELQEPRNKRGSLIGEEEPSCQARLPGALVTASFQVQDAEKRHSSWCFQGVHGQLCLILHLEEG